MIDELKIKKFMAEQLKKEIPLSDIQNMINEEFNQKLSFMEVRILASDLDDIDWSKMDPEPEETPEEIDDSLPPPDDHPGQTIVETSQVLRPGAIAGGSVKFASGATAEWYVDQTGRLGLDNVKGEPDENDVKEFQKELQKTFGQ